MSKQMKNAGFLLYLLGAVLVYILNPFPALGGILQDAVFQHPSKPQADIFVIGVDDRSQKELGPWNQWSRSTMARMIRLLNADPEHRPAVIGVDVMYFGQTDPAADADLAQAAAQADNLVLASQVEFKNQVRLSKGNYQSGRQSPVDIQLPQPPLDTLAECGFTNVFLDSDGVVRRSLLQVELDGKTYDNFSYAVYQKYQDYHGKPAIIPPIDNRGMWIIPYSAKPGTYGQGLSFSDVLDGRVSPKLFENAVVLIGAYASGMMDSYYTPLEKGTTMYGAEINANMVQALCGGKFKQLVQPWIQVLLLVAALSLCRQAFSRDVVASIAALTLCTVGYLAAAYLLYQVGWILELLYFPASVLILFLFRNLANLLDEQRDRLQTLNTFQRYVSPEVAEHLLSSRRNALSDSVRRHIAVMFIDIRGFTSLSENLSPEQIVDILNEYLTLTSSVIFHNGGTVDKFIGDATMALFNAPMDLDDYVYQAVKAACEIVEGGQALREQLARRYGKTISFGIGVHCGDAVVGNIGAPFRMDYTAIGDTVNTAARLESVAGPGQVLVSAEVCQQLGGRVSLHAVGAKQLKGKSQPVELYQVDGLEALQPVREAAGEDAAERGTVKL